MTAKEEWPEWLCDSLRIALLGEIYSNIRAIAIRYNKKEMLIRYYLDREVTEYDEESLAAVATNFDALLPIKLDSFDTECFFTKELQKDFDPLDGFFYSRREYGEYS